MNKHFHFYYLRLMFINFLKTRVFFVGLFLSLSFYSQDIPYQKSIHQTQLEEYNAIKEMPMLNIMKKQFLLNKNPREKNQLVR